MHKAPKTTSSRAKRYQRPLVVRVGRASKLTKGTPSYFTEWVSCGPGCIFVESDEYSG